MDKQNITPNALEKAAKKLTKAWAKWHDHAGLMPDAEILDAVSDIFDALGLELVEGESGKHRAARKGGAA